jgi:hypothetical protein
MNFCNGARINAETAGFPAINNAGITQQWEIGIVGQRMFGQRQSPIEEKFIMRKFVIERDIPGVGSFDAEQLCGAAQTSNAALDKLGTDIQWVESFVTAEKTFCIYLATGEDIIKRHAEISGFPANVITEVTGMIDPTT